MKQVSLAEAAVLLKKGDIGILPTDTLYGLVASALDREAVELVYRVRGRDEGKPCIVLISDQSDIERFFGLSLSGLATKLAEMWPGKVSVILPCPDAKWAYLHRGTETVAFRVPDRSELRELLRKVGPLIAPSANPQGMPPAKTIEEAEEYFGSDADFYVDAGMLDSEPSTVVRFMDGKLSVVREGAVKISNQES
ncbi:MAG: threonylcarbamoyl-AMP synthase [Candidatus Moranbacteria bacterium]|nr:threonylcarbamoyl-AMP synthase [Candidatus Moranbacteria bacterium]